MKKKRTTPKEFEFDMTTFEHTPLLHPIRPSPFEVSNLIPARWTADAVMEDQKEEEEKHE